MFEDALLIDAAGRPTMQHHQAFSRDWDRIKEWSDNIYMPYTVTPIGSRLKPASDMYSAAVGKIDVTRFCYGIPVSVGKCSPEAGNILVLTTIRGSSWLALMDYVVRAIAESPDAMSGERLGARVQELIAAQLLDEWATQAGLQLGVDVASAEPAYVRSAEEYIDTFARSVPTASEIAAAVGVSVRALTAGFRRYRDTTPGQRLRARRLEGVRSELLRSDGKTVSEIANAWGYVNLGMFAAAYRKRFGELPSETRNPLRGQLFERS